MYKEGTIGHYLNQLPDEYREKALSYTNQERQHDDCCSLSRALGSAFDWEEVPEGYDYWEELHDTLAEAENKLLKEHVKIMSKKIRTFVQRHDGICTRDITLDDCRRWGMTPNHFETAWTYPDKVDSVEIRFGAGYGNNKKPSECAGVLAWV